LDGYDKLKKYGLAVHGCIDGYSRRIIWLRCSASNNNPNVIGSYYLDAVEKLMLCPNKLRSDRGSENSVVAALQSCLTDNLDSHVFGSSTTNQRIESFWAVLRRQLSQWWINLLEDMSSAGLLDVSTERDLECVRYCFMNLLQADLDKFQVHWNTHRIRPTVGARCPAGIPDELYFLPRLGATDCCLYIDPANVVNCRAFVQVPTVCRSNDVQQYFDYLSTLYSWQRPSDWQQGVLLYTNLRSELVRTNF
jgi:hypothetical protein